MAEGGKPGRGSAQLERISEAVSDVRHAINSPLTAILAEVELMLMDADDLNDEQVRGLKAIEEMAGRIRDLVAQLKTIAEL